MLAAKANQSWAKQREIEYLREQQRLEEIQQLKKRQAKARAVIKDRAVMALVVFCGFLMAFSFTWLEAKIGQCGYNINQLKAQIAQVETQSERLELEIADLASLARIEEYAAHKLGMKYPAHHNIAYIDYQPVEAARLAAAGGAQPQAAKIVVHQEGAASSSIIQGLYQLLGAHFSREVQAAAE